MLPYPTMEARSKFSDFFTGPGKVPWVDVIKRVSIASEDLQEFFQKYYK